MRVIWKHIFDKIMAIIIKCQKFGAEVYLYLYTSIIEVFEFEDIKDN